MHGVLWAARGRRAAQCGLRACVARLCAAAAAVRLFLHPRLSFEGVGVCRWSALWRRSPPQRGLRPDGVNPDVITAVAGRDKWPRAMRKRRCGSGHADACRWPLGPCGRPVSRAGCWNGPPLTAAAGRSLAAYWEHVGSSTGLDGVNVLSPGNVFNVRQTTSDAVSGSRANMRKGQGRTLLACPTAL